MADRPKRGQPTSYRDGYAAEAYSLALLGVTDQELANHFDVTERTINNWKVDHPDFFQSLKDGKAAADARIGKSLFERAEGFEWTEQQAIKIKVGPHEEKIEIVEVTKRVPPDTTACIFWLKNRRSANWRDKVDHEHAGNMTIEVVKFASGQ